MTKHTPGPWVADMVSIDDLLDNGNDPLFVFVGSDDDETRMDICDVHSWHGIEQRDANARLIAAAPDGLEANKLSLRNVEAMLYMLPVKADASERQSLETWASIVRAAIAKAEGGAG